MLTLANSRTYETAILISGDRDYLETVRSVKSQGMRVEIYSWRDSLSDDLAAESSCDVVYLDDHKKELMMKTEPDVAAEELLDTESEN